MALASITLDPGAQSYADLSELDSAAATKLSGIEALAEVNPADLAALDSAQNTKLNGIEELAEVNPADLDEVPDSASRFAAVEADAKADQTGPEMRDLVVGITDVERQLVITSPQSLEHKVISVQVDADLKLNTTYNVPAEP